MNLSFGPWQVLREPCAYDPQSGTAFQKVASVLKLANVNSTLMQNMTLDRLAEVTKNGYPALVGIGKGSKMGHSIVVDYVLNDPRGRFIFARDPTNVQLMSPETRQLFLDAGFNPKSVYTESDFLGDGGFTGDVLYAHP